MNNAYLQAEKASEGYEPDPKGIEAVLPEQDTIMDQLLGYAKDISSTAADGVNPDDEGITDYAQTTSNAFAEFLDYASDIAERSKGGIDENSNGCLSCTTSSEEKPTTLVSSLMEWASDLTTISGAGASPNPKGIITYAPEVVKVVEEEPENERITWQEWFETKFFTLDTVYMIYGWPYFAVD